MLRENRDMDTVALLSEEEHMKEKRSWVPKRKMSPRIHQAVKVTQKLIIAVILIIVGRIIFSGDYRRSFHRVRQYPDDGGTRIPTDFEKDEPVPVFEYKFEHSKVCDLDGNPTFVFKSSRANFDRRQSMRHQMITLGYVNYFFIVGAADHTEKSFVTKRVEKEADKYTDMIESNFVDTYYNLTLKSFGALDFFATKCAGSRTLFLMDDDVRIKYPRSLDRIKDKEDDRITCLHNIKLSAPVLRNGKWGVDYPLDHFPNYCTGPGMAFTKAAARELLKGRKATREFKIDDVFISGILRFKLNIPLYHEKAVYVPEVDFTLF